MTAQFDQIDAQLARIAKNMATVRDVRLAVFCCTAGTALVAALLLWLV
jgi:hypothetical protein